LHPQEHRVTILRGALVMSLMLGRQGLAVVGSMGVDLLIGVLLIVAIATLRRLQASSEQDPEVNAQC